MSRFFNSPPCHKPCCITAGCNNDPETDHCFSSTSKKTETLSPWPFHPSVNGNQVINRTLCSLHSRSNSTIAKFSFLKSRIVELFPRPTLSKLSTRNVFILSPALRRDVVPLPYPIRPRGRSYKRDLWPRKDIVTMNDYKHPPTGADLINRFLF